MVYGQTGMNKIINQSINQSINPAKIFH